MAESIDAIRACPICGKRPFKETRIICGTNKREKRIACYCCSYQHTQWKYHLSDAIREWNTDIEIHCNKETD